MDVILRQKIQGLGDRGDVVKVKEGYARNFLFPKRLALPSTASQRRVLEEEGRLHDVRDAKLQQSAQALAEKMNGLSCTIVVQAGEEDKLYGSVTGHDVAKAISDQGFAIDHKQIVLEEPIKKLGVYSVSVRLHREVEVPVKIWVVKE
ncbi:MAG: 50S ribosomal protein L9 [Candidatus Krumholzibacteria bacterium]|nr:50S ribosomal protein L9 [Candidatus Krumholzibacteria bacterium]